MRSVLAARMAFVVMFVLALGAGVGLLLAAQDREEDRYQGPGKVIADSFPWRPLSPPDSLSPPDEGPPPEPSATYPPAPITPGSEDTSDWETYVSPLGVTLKYPPTWQVVQFDPLNNYVRILNEKAQQEHARRVAEGIDEEPPVSGEAWVEIGIAAPQFDVEGLFAMCGGTASTLSFAGRPAVRCGQQIYWVGLPSGAVLHLAYTAAAIDGTPATLELLDTILSTASFDMAR